MPPTELVLTAAEIADVLRNEHQDSSIRVGLLTPILDRLDAQAERIRALEAQLDAQSRDWDQSFRQVERQRNAAAERARALEAERDDARSQLAARGPYCALHGKRQPCPEHRWICWPEDYTQATALRGAHGEAG
jgi:DNA anti-recombination protein RmuC